MDACLRGNDEIKHQRNIQMRYAVIENGCFRRFAKADACLRGTAAVKPDCPMKGKKPFFRSFQTAFYADRFLPYFSDGLYPPFSLLLNDTFFMAWFDIFAFGVTAACIVISMTRGVIVEVVALVTWVASFIAARIFAAPVSEIAFKTMQPRMLATVLSFVLVFAASLLVLRLLRSLLTSAVSSVGLGGVNRMLGGVFGALKGVLIVTVAVLACSFTDLPESDGWRKSVSAPFFETLADAAVPYLKGKRQVSGGAESDNITDSGVQDTGI